MSTSRSMSPSAIFILGASDPEMETIERLLRDCGERVIHALGPDGARVRAADAYRVAALSEPLPAGATVYWVECDGPAIPRDAVAIDHHRIGDPGYGRPPAEFLPASSVGQVCRLLSIETTPEIRLVAAADHCLAAAYRGECPGVDPDALMRWRAESRAAFQRRPVESVLADVERARAALRAAPIVDLAAGVYARDLRGQQIPELPEAAAREGLCFLASLSERDGRVKVVCQSGTPTQIEAFMRVWGPAQGLVDIYGDPARGFAGGYQ